MNPTLYYLRSSEQQIALELLYYAKCLDEAGKNTEDFEQLQIYHKHYGLTSRDFGLYALYDNIVAGAIWLRKLKKEDGSQAFLDEECAVLHIGVKPEFRNKGIGSAMMEQLLMEASVLYPKVSVSVKADSKVISFYEKFGFEKVKNLSLKSYIDGSELCVMSKTLTPQEIIRPQDNYDPRRWMD